MSRHAAPDRLALTQYPVPPRTPAHEPFVARTPRQPALSPANNGPAAGVARARTSAVPSEQLRAAPATPPVGGIMPAVLVTLNGATVFGGLNGLGQPYPVTLVESLRVTWGRAGVLDQADSPTNTVKLFVTAREWLRAQGNMIGWPITLQHSRPHPTTGEPIVITFYRGRVTRVDVDRHVAVAAGTRYEGLLVTLTTASVLTDLANRMISSAPWPREPMNTRRARLETLVGDLLTGGISLRPFWNNGTDVAPMDVDNRPALDLIRQLYDTTGDRMTYQPATNGLSFVQRRDFVALSMGQLWYTDIRGGRAYARSRTASNASGQQIGFMVDADHMAAADETVSRAAESRITRIQVGFTDAFSNDARASVTLPVPGSDESTEGRRVLSVDTAHAYRSWADVLASDLAELSRQEGQAWQLPPFRWDTRATLGFETQDQVVGLLTGGEIGWTFFLQGSWLPELGIEPIFGASGGVIEYVAGRWIVTVQPAPIVKKRDATARADAIASAQLQVRHASHPDFDAALTPERCDESLTVQDFEFIGWGLGMTTIYADGEG